MKEFFKKIMEIEKGPKNLSVIDAIKNRRSCRSYHTKKVSFEIIFEILNTALNYPCAGNIVNTSIVYIENKQKIEKISDLCCEQLWVSESSNLIIVLRDDKKVLNSYPEVGKKYSLQATAACIQNILILANYFGLGACWVLACDDSSIKELIGADENLEIDAIIPIGNVKGVCEKQEKSCPYATIYFENFGNKRRI